VYLISYIYWQEQIKEADKMIEEWVMEGDEPGVSYRIQISIPQLPPQQEALPVIYVLDGHNYFGMASDVIRLQSGNAQKTGVKPAMVVGILLDAEDSAIRERRFYDFTPHVSDYTYPERFKGKTMGKHGGAEQFLDWLLQKLQPRILDNYYVQVDKQCLYGHSLSGLFSLYTMLKRPDAFQCYLAISPSIWWNEKQVHDFLNQTTNSKLFLAVGEKEGFMVEDSMFFVDCLPSMMKETTECYVARDENHASIVPATMSRAFRYFFR
jgi:uncharacterized protein